jgi:deazaflavin-dependent oxidoreductase (nitroreductase family)
MSQTDRDTEGLSKSLHGDEHVRRYEETDGELGYLWKNDSHILILTTTGRKTGKTRKHALIFGRDGDDVLVVASKGGAPTNPDWYENLAAQPDVQVQILGERYPAVARTATPEEKQRLWPIMTDAWPSYDDYQAKTDRDIPLVILEQA